MSRPISDPVFDIGRDLQRAYDEGYKQGRYDEKVETETSLPSKEKKMNRQRKVVITVTYNELGTIVDTKAEELDSSAQPEHPESAKEYCAECDHIEMCRWYPYEGCEFRSLPSAERPAGEWIKDEFGITVCSECKRPRRDSRVDHINFCNSCGARMINTK